MADKTIDARELPCPQPVVLTRAAILSGETDQLIVIVSDPAQAENVAALARNQGWEVQIETQGEDGIYLKVSKSDTATMAVKEGGSCGTATNIVVLIACDKFGQGADELGGILMRAFIKTVREIVPQPRTLIFVNSGIKLTIAGSELLPDLELLANAGIQVLSCGTCLDYFKVKDQLAVGKVSNMFEIATTLLSADRVIRL